MKSLIIYATNSGGTYFATRAIEETVKEMNVNTLVCEAALVSPDHISDFDLVLLGSCTWDYGGKEGQMHIHFSQLQEKIGAMTFPRQKFAQYALGDASYRKFAGAADCLQEFVEKIGGKQVGEALRIDRFYDDQHSKERQIRDWVASVFQTNLVRGIQGALLA